MVDSRNYVDEERKVDLRVHFIRYMYIHVCSLIYRRRAPTERRGISEHLDLNYGLYFMYYNESSKRETDRVGTLQLACTIHFSSHYYVGSLAVDIEKRNSS